MKAQLRPVYERTLELLAADERVLAGFMTGSAGRGEDDAHSDVDPWFLVRQAEFEALDADLPGLFAEAGAEPILWWPERCNCETLRNYAVMFHHEGTLVQYDVTIQAWGEDPVTVPPGTVLFDKAGLLREAPPEPHPGQRMTWTVELYWVYVCIHCKYLHRGDLFRLAAAQQELLQAHVMVLRAQRPEVAPDWWPILAAKLGDESSRQVLLSYLETPSVEGVMARLPGQLAQFERDARASCELCGEAYPEAFAASAREYLAHATGG